MRVRVLLLLVGRYLGGCASGPTLREQHQLRRHGPRCRRARSHARAARGFQHTIRVQPANAVYASQAAPRGTLPTGDCWLGSVPVTPSSSFVLWPAARWCTVPGEATPAGWRSNLTRVEVNRVLAASGVGAGLDGGGQPPRAHAAGSAAAAGRVEIGAVTALRPGETGRS